MSKNKNCHRKSAEKEQEKQNNKNKEEKREQESHQDERIEKTGQATLGNIHLITIIGEVEGHDNLGNNAKTTKYEHILPQLAAIEDSREIEGLLVLLNTMGGDVEAGLAIAEMIASLSKPTVACVGRKSFHWCSHCGEHRLFLYRTVRNYGHSSGENEWHGDRCSSDL